MDIFKKEHKSERLSIVIYPLLLALAFDLFMFISLLIFGIHISLSIFFVPTNLGIIIGIALAFLKLQIEEKERKRGEFWENILQALTNGVIITDIDGKIEFANNSALMYHGYSLDEIKGFYIYDFVLPEYLDLMREYIQDIARGSDAEGFEIGFVSKDGTVRYAEITGKLVKYDKVELIEFIEVDTTEKRRFEEELISAERRFRELFENSVIGIYRSTPDGRIIDVNPAFVRLFGAKNKFEIIQRKAEDFYFSPDDRRRFIKALENTDYISNFENRLRRLDGREIIVREHVRAVRDKSGKVIYYEGMIEDITDQKKFEKQLRESEEKYRSVVESIQAGTYILQDGRFKFVSGQLAKILGFPIEEITNTKLIFEAIHPDDRKNVERTFNEQLMGVKPTASLSFRIIRKNGEVAWVEVLNTLITYEGKPALLGTMLDITDRIKAEQRNRIFSQLLLNLNVGVIITDAYANILEVNDAFCKITGYKKDELIGRNPRILKSGIHDRKFYENMWRSLIEEGYWSGEIINRKKNGELYPAFLSISSVKDEVQNVVYYLGIQADITEQKKAEEKIRYQANLLENVNDAIIATDMNFRITSWNKAAEKMYGYKAEEVLGKEISEVVPAEFPGMSRYEVRKILKEKGFWSGEVIHYNRRGEKIYVSSSLSVIKDLNGIVIGTVGINRDITAQKKAEEKLRMYAEQLELANAQLKELNQLKSEFLANTSHELRTPLNSIIGFLTLIKDGLYESEDELKAFIENSLSSAKHLLNIINDILDIAKIEAGKLELNIEDVDVNEILDEVWRLSHVQAEQKKIEFKFIAPDEIVYVRADRNRLKQVLLNLIGNSIKFTHKGGITVKAEPLYDKGFCRFTVVDTGIGISKEKQAKLFQKFVQADGTTTRKYGGTGLGLAITKSLVEFMGGIIDLYSEGEGKGTTVTFTIPLSEKTFIDEEKKIEAGKIYGELGKLILVVDDDMIFATYLKNLLTKHDFRIIWADTARSGWEYLNEFKPDILIVDYALPHKASDKIKNGFDLVLKIYETKTFQSIPIIVLTGHPHKVIELFKLSMIKIRPNVLEKPVEPSQLLAVLKEHVSDLKKSKFEILLADDDINVEFYIRKILPGNFKLDVARNGKEALEKIKKKKYDVLLLDLMMPEVNGYDVIRELRLNKLAPELPIIVVTNYPEPSTEEERKLLSKSMGIIVIDKHELHDAPDKLVKVLKSYLKQNDQ